MSAIRFLEGKTALVTGAAKRIGKACAAALAEAGARVIVHYNQSEEDAAATRDLIRTSSDAVMIKADLKNEGETVRLFEDSVKQWGSVDILINSASVFEPDDIWTADSAALFENIKIHTAAPLILSRMFYSNQPDLSSGDIINFLDTRINDYDKQHVSYHLSKQNLHSLTRMLASEFAPKVKVNAIAPGLILPPPGETEEYLQKRIHTNPLEKSGSLEDISDAVLFLLANGFVTGQVLFIDGGRHLKGSFYGL